MNMPRVLVVDDEKLIVKGIRFSLEQDGMEVDCAYDGEEAINMARAKEYDIVLLDVMLPKHDGYEVCQAIREFSEMPIIMLTAKGSDMDKILGLEYGADDYVTKPFNILELKARVRALLRRAGMAAQQKGGGGKLTMGHITLDADARAAWKDGQSVELTAKEFDLMELLLRNPGRVYSRGEPAQRGVGGTSTPGTTARWTCTSAACGRSWNWIPPAPEYILTQVGAWLLPERKLTPPTVHCPLFTAPGGVFLPQSKRCPFGAPSRPSSP